MENSKHRERVLKAFNRQQPDRIPIDLGSKGSSLVIGAYDKFKEKLGLEKPTEILDTRLRKPVYDYFNDAVDPPSSEGESCGLEDISGTIGELDDGFVPADNEVWLDFNASATRDSEVCLFSDLSPKILVKQARACLKAFRAAGFLVRLLSQPRRASS